MVLVVQRPADREEAILFVPEHEMRREFRNQVVVDLSSREKHSLSLILVPLLAPARDA